MCKHILEDPLFLSQFNTFFKGGIDEAALASVDRNILTTFGSATTIDILNILKASVISGSSYTNMFRNVKRFLVDRGETRKPLQIEKAVLSLTLKYIASQPVAEGQTTGIERLLRKRRDFVAEIASVKEGVPQTEVTEDMRNAVLTTNELYSITDEPVLSWDEYFFNVCRQAARNSKCLSRRIGAVLVRDKSVISTGYNGPPRGVPRCDLRWELDPVFIAKYKDKIIVPLDKNNPICPRHSLGAKSGELLDICPAGHAEENAILNAARLGIKTKGTTMYMTCGIPCFRCLIKIINAGVNELVVTGISFYDDNSEFLINNSDIKIRLYNF